MHPTAYISPTVKIGRGVAVFPKSIVNSYCVFEDVCLINSGAIIDHNNRIGAFAHVCLGAIIKVYNFVPQKIKIEAGKVVERNTYHNNV